MNGRGPARGPFLRSGRGPLDLGEFGTYGGAHGGSIDKPPAAKAKG